MTHTEDTSHITVDLAAPTSGLESAEELLSVESETHAYLCYFTDLFILSETEPETKLARPVRISLCEEAGRVKAENDALSIFACGFTPEEAILDFERALVESWEGLRNVPNEELTQDAIDLKSRLAALFGA